jgi:hypothetical protein
MAHAPFRGGSVMESTFSEYTEAFIQRIPKYGVKTKKHGWITRNKPLSDPAIKAHLAKKYTVGGIAPWYPQYALLDMDDKSLPFVEDVRGELGLDEENSMLMASESSDSYHCILRPTVDSGPPTRYQLNKSFKNFASTKGIEIYPQTNKVVRLPFGEFSKCLDFNYSGLETWQDKLFWFNKLDDFSLSTVSGQQYEIPFTVKTPDNNLPGLVGPKVNGWYGQGGELLKGGLQELSTRHESQAKVIYYLWRQNVPYEDAIAQTWAWINCNHNGFSKDILKFAPSVFKEIQRQATHIYTNYHWAKTYPDTTHNHHNGYICRPDIGKILDITGASLPRSRFLFHIVKYSYPRRHRTFVPVHRDLLRTWSSSRGSKKYLNELTEKGLVKRGKAYSVGRFSKSLKLSWDFKTADESVLFEGRSVDTFEDTIKTMFKPDEFKALMRGATNNKAYVRRAVKSIYDPA